MAAAAVTAPLVASPLTGRKRPEVESLRGLAALAVLVAHGWGIGHDYAPRLYTTWTGRVGLLGGEGLALFFALSGYLLCRLFLGERRTQPLRLGTYFRHRVARILPTWWLVLAALLVVHDDGVRASSWWRFPLLLQGFWPDTVVRVDGPAWSLAVEAQFYVLLPLLVLALRRGRGLALLSVSLLTVVAAVVAVTTVAVARPSAVWRYGLVANFVYFTPGLLLAVLEDRTSLVAALRKLRHARSVLLVASLPFWTAVVWLPRTALLAAVGAGLTVAAVALPLEESWVVRLLRGRVPFTLGVLSFGIYLWHEPVLQLLHRHGVSSWTGLLVVGTPIAVALAGVSYVLVEAPALRLRDARWSAAVARGADGRRLLAGAAAVGALVVVALTT